MYFTEAGDLDYRCFIVFDGHVYIENRPYIPRERAMYPERAMGYVKYPH